MKRRIFDLDSRGYFTRGGQRILPVGVNYWPASCGVQMWRAWPEEEIRRDLDLVSQLGFNCVRFFLLWQDFEPKAGRYNGAAFRRLAQFLGWCRERKLLAQPSLMVGWMSGGIFWPEWKGDKNLFTDPGLGRRAAVFAAKAARVCAAYCDTVLAIDQGNEICCLPDCLSAPPAAVERWCGALSAAIRKGFPTALVISGNEQNQIVSDTGWRFGAQPGCDLYSMHAYPNSAWHSLQFDGMTDPLAQSLLPLYVKCARAFGPVMVQEFGTIFTIGSCCDDYLRAILPACWEAGANGFLWWSLRDFAANGHPYNKNAFEGPLGLAGADDRVKAVLRFFAEFAASLPSRPVPVTDQGEVALYWPRHYYLRDDPLNPGNDPRALSRRLAIAHFTLTELGHRVGIVRGDQPLENLSARTIVVAGAALTAEEVTALTVWVKTGGRLVWHGIDVTTWGDAATELVGAAPADLRAPRAEGVNAFGTLWNFREFPRHVFLEVVPSGAHVDAADHAGHPILLHHRLGCGAVAACLAQVDDTFAAESDDRAVRGRWNRWYEGMLALAGHTAAKDTSSSLTAPAKKFRIA
ncbi:MAG: cellulase family glycosylhydrolase [Opitutaceae bacterium]|nr:cellulase family glycosylhydrolase [Opitutaceae bacterium]